MFPLNWEDSHWASNCLQGFSVLAGTQGGLGQAFLGVAVVAAAGESWPALSPMTRY